jgi:hypothetical protein
MKEYVAAGVSGVLSCLSLGAGYMGESFIAKTSGLLAFASYACFAVWASSENRAVRSD